MRKITGEEFKTLVQKNPGWANTLTEPVEITTFADLNKSSITHLSPLLHFTGSHGNHKGASFCHTQNLKVAEGNFYGKIDFTGSAIERIGELIVHEGDRLKIAAQFNDCRHLKIAQGDFNGSVNFSSSGIEKIENLIIRQACINGSAAGFQACFALKVAEGTYPGHVDFTVCGIEKIGDLRITGNDLSGKAATFHGCRALITATGTYPGYVVFERAGIHRIENLVVTAPPKAAINNLAASFFGCDRLLSAAGGDYVGEVCFNNSAIHSLGEIPKSAKYQISQCHNLVLPKGWREMRGLIMDSKTRAQHEARDLLKNQPEIEI